MTNPRSYIHVLLPREVGNWTSGIFHFQSGGWVFHKHNDWDSMLGRRVHTRTHTHRDTHTHTHFPLYHFCIVLSSLAAYTQKTRICKPQDDEQSLVYYNSDFLAAQFPAVGFFLWLNSTGWKGRNKWGKEKAIPSKFPYQGLWTHRENGCILESFWLSFK